MEYNLLNDLCTVPVSINTEVGLLHAPLVIDVHIRIY